MLVVLAEAAMLHSTTTPAMSVPSLASSCLPTGCAQEEYQAGSRWVVVGSEAPLVERLSLPAEAHRAQVLF